MAIHVIGQHGLGDNLHSRAIIRELMKTADVWLSTPFPQAFYDLPGLRLLSVRSTLRTQAKNVARSAGLYGAGQPPAGAREIRPSYSPARVKVAGSVLAAMSGVCGVPVGDFRMPVPAAWRDKAAALFATDRPILVYRPLVARTEWGGSTCRNPDVGAYEALFDAIRGRFFVVSVADLVQGVEWVVGPQIQADATYHAGELDFEALAGLFARAALVYSAPGFATVLAQAVGTPAVCVFGGYEDATSFSAGARFTPWLPIEPITPCPCWSHTHACRKAIDMPRAEQRLKGFLNGITCPTDYEPADSQDRSRSDQVSAIHAAVLQPG